MSINAQPSIRPIVLEDFLCHFIGLACLYLACTKQRHWPKWLATERDINPLSGYFGQNNLPIGAFDRRWPVTIEYRCPDNAPSERGKLASWQNSTGRMTPLLIKFALRLCHNSHQASVYLALTTNISLKLSLNWWLMARFVDVTAHHRMVSAFFKYNYWWVQIWWQTSKCIVEWWLVGVYCSLQMPCLSAIFACTSKLCQSFTHYNKNDRECERRKSITSTTARLPLLSANGLTC